MVPMPSWDELSPGERARMREIIEAALYCSAVDVSTKVYDEIHRACRLRSRAKMVKETRKASALKKGPTSSTGRAAAL